MADRERERDLSKVLSNVEQDIGQGQVQPTHARMVGASSVDARSSVEAFAPQKYRNAGGDSLKQIHHDFCRVMSEFELRFKALMEEMKRAAG